MTNNHTKKIAILTWRLKNFGTALQSYALCRWLNNNGVECKVINYSLPSSDKIIRVNRLTFSSLLTKIRRRIAGRYEKKKNKHCMEKYADEISIAHKRFANFYLKTPIEATKPTPDNSAYFNKEYDFVIVGSDQVWSPKYLNETYFLDFVTEDKKVAYAPSLGVCSLTHAEESFISERIKKFHLLSVREKTSARMLGLTDDMVMCDPVLLFSGSEWNKLLSITPPP